MAGGTILKIGDAFVEVDFGRFSLFVSVAVVAGVFIIGVGVTGLAGNLPFVPMSEWESMAGQFGRGPGHRCVTAGTVCAEKAGVDVWFLMTARTFSRGPGSYLIGMAVNAIDIGVAAVQNEIIGMVKGVYEGVTAVMTGETIFAKQGGMVGGELRLAGGVTVKAVDQFGRELLFQVAVEAFKLRFIKVLFMVGQAEIGQAVMFKIGQCQQGDVGIPALMFGVAVFTAGSVVETAVEAQIALPLFGNGLVAFFAAFGRNTLPGGVTKPTIPFKFSMIVEAP